MTGQKTCHSPWKNPLSEGDDLARGYAETIVLNKRSSITTHTPAMSCAPTIAQALLSTPAPPPAISMARYTDKDLKQATQL